MSDSQLVLARGERSLRPVDEPLRPYGSGTDSDDLLRHIVGVLLRRKWVVLGAVALSMAVTVVVLYLETPMYRASAVIRLEDTQQALAGGLDPGVGAPISARYTDFLLSQLEVLRSAQVMGEVVDRTGLRLTALDGSHPAFLDDVEVSPTAATGTMLITFENDDVVVSVPGGAAVRGAYGATVELAGVRFRVRARRPGQHEARLAVGDRRDAIGRLTGSLRTEPRAQTDVVEIDYATTAPDLAASVVNTAVEQFRERNISTARQRSQRRRVFLEVQMLEKDSLLAEAQEKLTAFRSRRRVYSSSELLAAQQTGLMDLDDRLEDLEARQQMHRSILGALEVAAPGEIGERLQAFAASPEIAANQVVAGLFTRLLSFEAVRDSLLSGPWAVAPGHPDVVRLEAEILSTTARLETAFRGFLATLDAQRAALEERRTEASARLAILPGVEVEQTRLVEAVRSIQRTVDQLSEEYQRARIAEAVEAGQVEVIDLAAVPLSPESTGPTSRLLVGLVFGLVLGGAVAYLGESLNTRIRESDEMEQVLRVASVGVIPRIPRQRRSGRAAVGRVLGWVGRRPRLARGDGAASELVILAQRASAHAEAFRSIRTNLLFSDAVQSLRSLVVTSPIPEEGKTTAAANLAVAYAQQGLKVLLIDCDLRRPRLHRLFGCAREPGLTELALGHATWEEVRHDVSVENLEFVGSGTRPPNPSELLGSVRMRELIDEVHQRYDLIVLDTPPLTAGPDAAVLGAACDGVVLIVRAGKTEREAGQQAVRQLRAVGARIVGAVLNDPDGELRKYGRYYAYAYAVDET